MSAIPQLDPDIAVWKALADPSRRRILDELRARPMPVGKLAALFDMTRFGVMQHLKVLQAAGLVLVETRGRERWNHVNPGPLRAIYRRWIRPFEEDDADRLLRLKQHLEAPAEAPPPETPTMSTQALSQAEVLVEIDVAAPRERVWSAFVNETAKWWHPGFNTRPEGVTFTIEPELGGRAFEDWGGGNGQVWGVVNGMDAGRFIQIIGDTDKAWGGPSRGIMNWRFEDDGEGTKVRLEHSLFGNVSEETRKSLTEGWQFLIRDSLKRYVETGQGPDVEAALPECNAT